MGHGGQAVGQGHGAGNNAFHSSWDASGGHTHHTWRVPAGRGGQTCEVTYAEPHLLYTVPSAQVSVSPEVQKGWSVLGSIPAWLLN